MMVAMTTPPPARSNMQRLSNKIGDATVRHVQEDMKATMRNMTHINELRGLPKDTPVNISIDVRYNSNTFVLAPGTSSDRLLLRLLERLWKIRQTGMKSSLYILITNCAELGLRCERKEFWPNVQVMLDVHRR